MASFFCVFAACVKKHKHRCWCILLRCLCLTIFCNRRALLSSLFLPASDTSLITLWDLGDHFGCHSDSLKHHPETQTKHQGANRVDLGGNPVQITSPCLELRSRCFVFFGHCCSRSAVLLHVGMLGIFVRHLCNFLDKLVEILFRAARGSELLQELLGDSPFGRGLWRPPWSGCQSTWVGISCVSRFMFKLMQT